MEIRQLKYFLKLAETLNFSEASHELFITQSTLSQQILNLERELDQQLFLRNSHEVVLTEAGHLLVPMARESIHAVDNCLQRMQELKHLLTGELNIGVTHRSNGSERACGEESRSLSHGCNASTDDAAKHL